MNNLKRIYDSVHGFIYFSPLEKELIDSYVFQRLHALHQLGVAYLVYPGATHTRFEHSIGVMHIATRIFDQILQSYEEPLDPFFRTYWQVVRFAALCHDLGHLPFSHAAEKVLLGEVGHEKWTQLLIKSSFLQPIWDQLQAQFPQHDVVNDIVKISLGEKKFHQILGEKHSEPFTPWEHVLTQIITGDFFGADRIDYLLRDARATGVSYGLFDYQQLIETLRILPGPEGSEGDLVLGIEENGIASCEALLLSRHFMHRRVYQYPSVKAYSFHMTRFLQKLYYEHNLLSSLEKYLSYSDCEVLTELRKAFITPSHLGHEDALSLLGREDRYLAVELSSSIEEDVVTNYQNQYSAVFVREKKEDAHVSFPVIRRDEKIVSAASCFSIVIPSFASTWMYISPKHQDAVQKLLEMYPLKKNDEDAACRK
jgi:HD superfamily phosphohydrolase